MFTDAEIPPIILWKHIIIHAIFPLVRILGRQFHHDIPIKLYAPRIQTLQAAEYLIYHKQVHINQSEI